MLDIDYKGNITISSGDIFNLIYEFDRDLTSTEWVYFTVKKNLSDTVAEITLYKQRINSTTSANKVKFEFENTETKTLSGEYWYDIRVLDGQVSDPTSLYTPFEPKIFKVIKTVRD